MGNQKYLVDCALIRGFRDMLSIYLNMNILLIIAHF